LQTSNYWKPGDSIAVNLLPKFDAMENILMEKGNNNNITIGKYLNGLMPKSLIIELQKIWWPEYKNHSICEISNKELRVIGALFNEWTLWPTSTEGYRTAEVTLGGIDTDEIDSKTMEVKNQKGLYCIGEVVDVTGHLGGFNFQWAWASGYTAGLFA
jgi:predicted Rossmann fold flavoprotein